MLYIILCIINYILYIIIYILNCISFIPPYTIFESTNSKQALNTAIGQRVTLFERLGTGEVDEEEKKKAMDEASHRRRLSQILMKK